MHIITSSTAVGIRTGGLYRLCFLKPLEQAAGREGKAAFVTPRRAPSPCRHHAPSSLLFPARSTSGWKRGELRVHPHVTLPRGAATTLQTCLPCMAGSCYTHLAEKLCPCHCFCPREFPSPGKSLWFFRAQDCSHHFAVRARPKLCSRGQRDEPELLRALHHWVKRGRGTTLHWSTHPRPLEALLLPTKLITALGELINLSTPACKKKRKGMTCDTPGFKEP